MAHIHEIKDAEAYFIINATSREISNSAELPALVQNDHNSERFTFVVPRYVDGHDMSICNKTRVHYLNIDAATKKQYADVYEVDDLRIDETDETKVVCTWLISRYATQYAGSLNFIIQYACEKDGVIDYAWNTAVFKGVTVKNGINNAEQIITEYTDILEKWKQEILEQLSSGTDEKISAEDVTYSNDSLADKSGTVKGALDEAVNFVTSELPGLVAEKHGHSNKDTLDNLGENAEGELTYKGQDVGAPKPKILSAIVDGYEEGVPTAVIHAGFYPVSIGIDIDNFPTNARAKRIEIPDVVNETDEYIVLEDMATKDAENSFSSPYFIMYPKNAEGVYASSLVALAVFPLETTNAFYDAATAGLFSGKEIKIYYEIEE